MKRISLLTAAVSNGGAFLDAGSEPTVGDENDQISAARATLMVETGLAVDADAGAEEASPKTRK